MSSPLQITLPADLTDAIVHEAARRGTVPEALALEALRRQFPIQSLPTTSPVNEDPAARPRTLADRLARYIGAVSSGDGTLSEHTGKKYTEILVKEHKQSQ